MDCYSLMLFLQSTFLLLFYGAVPSNCNIVTNSLTFPADSSRWHLLGDASFNDASSRVELVRVGSSAPSLSYGGINSANPLSDDLFRADIDWLCEIDLAIENKHSNQTDVRQMSDFLSIVFAQFGSFADYIAGPRFINKNDNRKFFGVMIELLEITPAEHEPRVHIYGMSNQQKRPHPKPSLSLDDAHRGDSCRVLTKTPDLAVLKLIKRKKMLTIKVNDCKSDSNVLDLSPYMSPDVNGTWFNDHLHLAITASSTSHGLRRSLQKVNFYPLL